MSPLETLKSRLNSNYYRVDFSDLSHRLEEKCLQFRTDLELAYGTDVLTMDVRTALFNMANGDLVDSIHEIEAAYKGLAVLALMVRESVLQEREP